MDRRRKKRRKKLRRNALLVFGIIFVIFMFWAKIKSNKTKVLYTEEYIESLPLKAYLLKQEEVIHFNPSDDIEFLVDQGNRVPINKIIANNISINLKNQMQYNLEIINWKLENEMYSNNNLFYNDIEEIKNRIEKINKEINDAQEGSDTFIQLNKEKEELLHKNQIIIDSFKYITADKKTLEDLKNQYISKLENNLNFLKLQNLDIDYPGYIYFTEDGYENILHIELLKHLSPDYIKQINDITKQKYSTFRGQVLKVVNDDFMYIIFTVPQDILTNKIATCINQKNQYLNILDNDSLENYYAYLNKRVDILKTFPKIDFKFNEKTISGYLIDVKDSKDDENLFIIEIKENINELINERIINIDLHTKKIESFIVPNNAIIDRNGKNYIVSLYKGYFHKYIQINIQEYVDKQVLLIPNDNEELKNGMEILLNP